MYGDDFSEIYVSYYEGKGKDYDVEAEEMVRLIRDRKPDVASLLDVACGTGEHLNRFGQLVEHVEGVELSESMVAVGRERFPHLALHPGDMRDFALGRTFDAVTCMFSSIGHCGDVEGLHSTAKRIGEHLVPGGVMVVEPWWSPEEFIDGYVAGGVVERDGRTIARVSHSARVGDATRITVHMAVADPELGLRHFTEVGLLALFTREQYLTAFDQAGITAEYVSGGPLGRGLYVGARR